jgi:GNAT superfamily N-acetyltransferase
MTIRIRAATEDDKPFLQWLEEACMRAYAVALWGVWCPRADEDFTIDGLRIIADECSDVGCVAVIIHSNHIWLDKLYLAPSHQGRGIGAAMLKIVIAEAAASNRPVRLSVLTTNPAIALYIRHGFRIYAETPERNFLST